MKDDIGALTERMMYKIITWFNYKGGVHLLRNMLLTPA